MPQTYSVTTYQVLLRGYRSHGRSPEDLAKDLGLTAGQRFLWARADFKKSDCQVQTGERVLAACLSGPEDCL